MFSKINYRRVAALLACLTLAGSSVSASAVTLNPVTNATTSGSSTVRTAEQLRIAAEALAAQKAAEDAMKQPQQEPQQPVVTPEPEPQPEPEPSPEPDDSVYDPTYSQTVQYSPDYLANDLLKTQSSYMGNFKLTFYCPCFSCSAGWGSSTSSGAHATEGRTIAVDPSVIPMGSEVYIEGFGNFIAEDVGGAIKGNRIDIFVNSHSRSESLGVKYANVYVKN